MATDGRDRRWPRASSAPRDDFDTRKTNPVPILPLVVTERLRPGKTFRELEAALGLPAAMVRTLLTTVLDDPAAVPETVSASQLVELGPLLLLSMDTYVPERERRAARERVEAMLRGMAAR